MTAQDDDDLHRLAGAIVDGVTIDWASTESGVANHTRQIVRELAIIAAISDVHCSTPLAADSHAAASTVESVAGALGTWATFRLLEKIGGGAHGEVYRAWDTRLDREVALKLLPADVDEAECPTSTIHEGRLLARVRHPNVVTIYGAERIENRIGLWMEFINGRTLEQILQRGGVLSESETISIGLEICRAVAAVHGAGLLHRDIKAHNVMRSQEGRIALMDFGTGKKLEDDAFPDLAGTPLYLAPEILRGEPATVRSDIYSLGVLLYHLVTTSYPVRGDSVRDIRIAHDTGKRTPLHMAGGGVSTNFARIVDRAIDPLPERRYDSADALSADLVRSVPYINDASDWYLKGRALINRRGIPNVQKAAEFFGRAIAKDPTFAPAHAGLANAYAFLSFPFRGISFDVAYPIMRPAAVQALRLDPLLADAHAAMGWVYAFDHDWKNAEKRFEQSIRMDPGRTQTYTSYSVSTLQPLRKYDEALRLLRVASQHDPLSLDVQREIGEVQLFAGRYAEAVETFLRISEVEPDFPFLQAYLAKALTFAGRAEEALPRLEDGSPWAAQTYVMTDRRADAEKLAAESAGYPYRLAVISGALGNTERAIEALERASLVEPHRIGRLLIEPELASIREHLRVVKIRHAFNLP
jgi:serine/threonine-protein kinase